MADAEQQQAEGAAPDPDPAAEGTDIEAAAADETAGKNKQKSCKRGRTAQDRKNKTKPAGYTADMPNGTQSAGEGAGGQTGGAGVYSLDYEGGTTARRAGNGLASTWLEDEEDESLSAAGISNSDGICTQRLARSTPNPTRNHRRH